MVLPDKTRLVLVRHAESDGNAGGIVQGAGEYPLSVRGRSDASRAFEVIRLWRADIIASSDLSRAIDTAVLAAGRVDEIDHRLRERGAGEWEGVSRVEMERLHPGSLEDDARRPAGFEEEESVVTRMSDACSDLVTRQGLVVAFTHGAVLRSLCASLGAGRKRFSHLEGLCLGDDLKVLGRIGPVCRGGAN